jgi:hypothetical protein
VGGLQVGEVVVARDEASFELGDANGAERRLLCGKLGGLVYPEVIAQYVGARVDDMETNLTADDRLLIFRPVPGRTYVPIQLFYFVPAQVDNLQQTGKMMPGGSRHPDKDIRKAIVNAERAGWTVTNASGSGHCRGGLSCGQGCEVAIWSTPRRPGDIAKRIGEAVKKCDHIRPTS